MENKENQFLASKDIMENDNNSAMLYERSRIKALSEQREDVQKKTFTKWVNSHLLKAKGTNPIDDLYVDLQDGKALLKLLEVLSGEKMPSATKGKLRIHCIENVTKSIKFLSEQHVYLENLGAHDIVDGNPTLILGLIWTIILRFQIQNAAVDEQDGKKTSKESLLLWCQMKTAGYNNVNIRNFTTSWKDGLAFNALLHKHRPDVVDYINLSKANPVENMNLAFDIAEREFGVPQLLDAKDIIVDQPEEKSIMTYVGELCIAMNKMKSNEKQCKRLGNVITEAILVESFIENYEKLSSDLLEWIEMKIHWMDYTKMKQSLPGVREQLAEFSTYRLTEKPPKFKNRGLIEMKFFEIQSKLRSDNRKLYIPPEGKLISDINKAWENLEKAEHRMELKLYEELINQQKLEQLANHFNRKAQMRETWLHENDLLVHQNIFGEDLVTVVAAIRKHEALEGDINAHEERINALGYIADDLKAENYYKISEIDDKYEYIVKLWRKLLSDLGERRDKLDRCRDIQFLLQEADYLMDWIREISSRLQSKDFGKHLLGVENLLEKHKILISDIRNLENRVQETSNNLETVDFDKAAIDPQLVESKNKSLLETYNDLLNLADQRELDLNHYKTMWQYVEDINSDKEWAKEIIQLIQNPDNGHDLKSVERLIRKFELIVSDVNIRRDIVDEKLNKIKQFSYNDENIQRTNFINREVNDMHEILENLDEQIISRKKRLDASHQFHQTLADIDDVDATILEVRRLFENTDVGDKLSVTEFYLKQYEEQMNQVCELEKLMNELLDKRNTLILNPNEENEINKACVKMHLDFEDLIKLTEQRKHLLLNNKEKFYLLSNFDTISNWIVAKEKLLVTLIPTEELDELNVIKHRFDCFEDELKINSVKISETNNTSSALIRDNHPESELISMKQNELNTAWNELADLADQKKHELQLAVDFNQFLLECHETDNWIREKMELLKWTDELKDDLDGIMQLQRRLGSLQRDVQAIEAKVRYLNKEANVLKESKPTEEAVIDQEITSVNELWAELKIMLQDRDDRLNSSNELQKFFKDLDSFDIWLKRIQTQVATQEIPKDLPEAEKFCLNHQELLEEITYRKPEFIQLLQFGRQVSHSKDDPQYLLFNERLNVLETGWDALDKMWKDKNISLNQSKDAQTFIRDALQVDVILTKQETFLAKNDLPVNYELAEIAEREFETFKSSVFSNQPKIDSVVQFGESLISSNALSDKIRLKCEQITDRCKQIQSKLAKREAILKDQLKFQNYFMDVMEMEEWIAEKMITASDTSYHDSKDISTRYNRFRDFERELEANKDRVNDVIQSGNVLMEEIPYLKDEIQPIIKNLENQWEDLLSSAKEKSLQMEEANREIIFDESTKSMMSWVTEISSQIITTEEITEEYGLVEINEKMKDQEDKDKQLDQKRKMLSDIQQHAEKLKQQYPDRQDEFEQIQREVKVKLTQVEAPMSQRRDKLTLQKRVQQFLRDVEDEKKWIMEKIDFINKFRIAPDSLQVCLQKIRRLKTMANEIDNHAGRINDINYQGQELIDGGHPNSEKFNQVLDELNKLWDDLITICEDCQKFFDENKEIQEYLTEAMESEYWMSDIEFNLLREDKAKDEDSALNTMRKHEELINIINNYGSVISALGEKYQSILNRELPDAHLVAQKQERIDKMYATLLEMCLEKKLKIEDLIQFYYLYRSIQGLEEWIEERRIVAISNEVGSELEHCILLRERFGEFAIETNEIGGPRVSEADDMCNALIGLGHRDSAEIAQWKDRINEAWADLLELIETRIQLLKSAFDFFQFMSESSELLDLIHEKIRLIPEGVGKDAKTVAASQRKHHAFANEIERLEPFINNALGTADRLLPLYSTDKEQELIDRKRELQKLWLTLRKEYDNRNNLLIDASDLFKFYAMVRELMNWMSEIEIQIHVDDKARDVCGVELIISNHRSLKAEIDSRDENRTICITLGRTLINRKHPKKDDVRKKCRDVLTKYFNILENWREHQSLLEMILEVYQFAREAAVAEAWLVSQELQLNANEFGDTLNETLNLLKRHLVLERNLAAQDERFVALKKLTTLEMRNLNTIEKENERILERERKLNELILEFKTPAPSVENLRKSLEVHTPIIEDEIVTQFVENVHASPVKSKDESKEIKDLKPVTEIPKAVIGKESSSQQPRSGNLHRKHEWENSTKKAGNRKWYELYVIIDNGKMSFYKDKKHYDEDKIHTYKNEKTLELLGAQSSPAESYKKRPNVFRLRLQNGGEYLFEATDSADMNQWIEKINEIGGVDSSTSRYATLPNLKTDYEQDVGEKKKFPTLGRKQKP